MPTNEELAEEIEQLKWRIEQLMELVGSDKDSFTYHMMEADATKAQTKAVFDLMDEVWKSIKDKQSVMNHHEFEKRVYGIMPHKDGDYHFAEGIVSSLYEKGKYKEVFKHMQKSGMNIQENTK